MTTAHLVNFEVNGYATRENAIKAVQKVFGANHDHYGSADVQYLIAVNEAGRFVPVFLGERAIQAGVAHKFCIAG